MWLVFDEIWGAPAGAQMKKTFISGLRLLAQFTREPLSKDVTTAMERNFALRETINGTFDQVRALADGVLLEFGPSRGGDIALRDQIRAWQGKLRTLFITRTALWKYRMRLPGFKLPDAVMSAQTEFDNEVANTLENMADCLEGNANAPQASSTLGKAFDHLQMTTLVTNQASHTPRTAELDTFVMLCSNTEQLITSLSGELCLNRTA